MKKNVLIVNFNTQKLTDACIKSVNKFTPGCSVFVFDNSNKEPFVNTFENVNVFDNTKGQIIDFDEWLKKYPNRFKSNGRVIEWGSAKHSYTIEKCIDMMNEPFLLLDSDILLKRDVSNLFEEKYCYYADVINQDGCKIKRVLPYICFINTVLCKEKNIHYFNEKYMHGLYVTAKGDNYDTGGAFFLSCENARVPHGEINRDKYIVHYKSGSWVDIHDKLNKRKHQSVDEWLEKYHYLWDDTPIDEIVDNEEQKPDPEPVKPKEPVVVKDFKKKEEPKEVEIKTETSKVAQKKPEPKKTTIEEDKRVVFKRPVVKKQTEHATSANQVKKFALTGRKIALIKK